jgi:hypothetical protein
MQEWMESYDKHNTAFLERHLSDDYVSTFPDGMVLDKKGRDRVSQLGCRRLQGDTQ